MDDTDRPALDRRNMLKLGTATAAGLLLAPGLAQAQAQAQAAAPGSTGAQRPGGPLPPPSPVDAGHVEDGKVRFPAWRAPADTPSAPPPSPMPPEARVGFAIVGLGRLALEEILPAFAQSNKAKPVALVSGSPDKLRTVARQYGIAPDHCLSYAEFEKLRDLADVRAVYIVLPNGLHREYTERAARIGKHVLTEKPMAANSAEGRAMVAACARANVHLMVAYRIQFEPYNTRLMEWTRAHRFGRLVGMSAINVQTTAPDGAQQWRHKKALAGGGSLFDIGLYCINTARFLTGEEPASLWATQFSPPGDPRYAQVEETNAFTLRFPSNAIVQCFCSYGARDDKNQRLNFETAAVEMPNAYQYQGQRMTVIAREGDATSLDEVVLSPKNQFAAEIDHFATCVLENRRPRTPGEEGVQDHVVMEAVYESEQTGRPVTLKRYDTLDTFRGPPISQEA
jgi:predicted dehydrogenase